METSSWSAEIISSASAADVSKWNFEAWPKTKLGTQFPYTLGFLIGDGHREFPELKRQLERRSSFQQQRREFLLSFKKYLFTNPMDMSS
ncbi:unnamed protein product [Rhodiola kirilowii]